MGSRALVLALVGARHPLLVLKSHGEWDENTTLDGANQEIFCFD